MKTQIKKSLSLFLAVLMVLSCWVWVAPEKAEAADNTDGWYYVKYVIGEVREAGNADSWGGNTLTFSYKKTDGTEGTRVINLQKDVYNRQGHKDVVIWEGYLEGFPTSAGWYMKMSYEFLGSVYLSVGDCQVYVGADQGTCKTAVFKTDSFKWGNDAVGQGTNEATFTINKIDGVDPYVNSADNMDDATIDCPALGLTTVVNTTATMPATYWDQYGVKWLGSITGINYFVTDTSGGTEDKGGQEKGIWTAKSGEKGYVNINATMQKEFLPGENGTKDVYMVASYTKADGTAILSYQKITVSYTQYTYKFYGAGSVTGSMKFFIGLNDNTTSNRDVEYKGYYGRDLTKYPTGVVTADGYTFYGFWTVPQPTSGSASSNELSSKFAMPCSSTDYATYAEQEGSKVENGILTIKDGTRYYDAGEQWIINDKSVKGDREYYGWWLSEELTVKFYDIDGKYFYTVPVKYGNNQNYVEWPQSVYTQSNPYVNGALTAYATGKWVDTAGNVINPASHIFTESMMLTPQLSTSFVKEYNIAFVNQDKVNGKVQNIGVLAVENSDGIIENVTYTKTYNYRELMAVPADRAIPDDIVRNLQYSYEFVGWTSVKPENERFHVLVENADFDEDGKAIGINNDWFVKENVTYYAVYRRQPRTYAVKFWYYNASAEYVSEIVNVKYGDRLYAPTDSIPYSYAKDGFNYTFKQWEYITPEYDYDTFGYNQALSFTKETLMLMLSAVAGSNKYIEIQATYNEPVSAPYTVTFRYRDAKGNLVIKTADIQHDFYITSDIIQSLNPADEYDNGEALVSYTNSWKVVEGVADHEEYRTNDLLSFSPVSHVTFEAKYGNAKNFYTVTYVDGSETYSERVLVDSELPAWTVEVDGKEVVYEPSKADTETGKYVFMGWFDEKQTDETYAVTNGNKYEHKGLNISKVTSNVTLYPQFKYEPFTYTIKFMNYDGTVQLAGGSYEYGHSIETIAIEANKAAQSRAETDMYRYEFLGWDKAVPEFCEGKDMTFIAMYKPVYRYYEVKWYNSIATKDAQGNVVDWVMNEDVEIATSRHTFNSKLYTPSATIICPEPAPTGKRYVFAGWYHEDGTAYVRGTEVKGEMKLYAKYTLTNQPLNVTTVVGENTNTITVAYGASAELITEPTSGYVNATKHNEFAGWYTDAACTTDFTATTITENITLYAKFTESAHDFTNGEMTKAPTYYAKGEKISWCSCDKEKTKKTEEINELTDTENPTGIIYLGTLGSWSSADLPATDDPNNELVATPDTRVIITANDTGDVDALYNPSGIGIGIKLIRAFVYPAKYTLTANSYGAAQSVAYTVYESTDNELTNVANYTVKLSELSVAKFNDDGTVVTDVNGKIEYQALQSGEEYIIYYYVIDKAGRQLNRSVKTAKFLYDATAPEIDITGSNNSAKNPNIVTYCEKATIANVEVGATLEINGVATTLTTTSAAGLGSYTITEAGNYLITVTDAAGNSASKKIIVAAHEYDTKSKAPTCTTAGEETKECNVCGYKATEVIIPATGHNIVATKTDATCIDDASVVYACTKCNLSTEVEYVVDWFDDLDEANAIKFNENSYVTKIVDGTTKYLEYVLTEGNRTLIDEKNGHVFTKVDGNIVYDVVKEANCNATGLKVAVCEVCDGKLEGGYLSETIAKNNNVHVYANKTVVKAPTCTEEGAVYRVCKYNSSHLELINKLEKTGHTSKWVVVKAATCGEAGTMKEVCSKCNTIVTKETAYDWVEVADGDYAYVSDDEGIVTKVEEGVTYYQIYRLPKTNKHIYDIKTTDATADKAGSAVYKCENCDFEKTEIIPALVQYTVTFVNGTDKANITKTVGESVTIADPTKAATSKVNYTFIGWADKNGDIVKLPLTMSEKINGSVYTAQYKETPVLYTHTFVVPTEYNNGEYEGTETFKILVGAVGSEVKVSEEPVFAPEGLSKQYAFEFTGWKRIDAVATTSDETATEDDTNFIVSGDATFVAEFNAIPNKYQVTFYSSATKYIWSTPVEGGATVAYDKVDKDGNAVYPTKDYDDNYHYAFSGVWYTDSTLKTAFDFSTPIYANTRLYAGYTASEHSYDESKNVVTQAATCDLPELTKKVCSCGYEITVQTKDALGHDWDDGKTVDGVTTYTCKRDASHTKTDDVQTFTVKFVNYNGLAVQSFYDVVYGQKVDFTAVEPTRAASVEATYAFIGWKDGFSSRIYSTADIEALEITDDYTFVAEYKATTRIYRVTYVDVNNKTLQTGEFAYGAAIPAFTGTVPAKDRDDTHHYVFASWSVGTDATVAGNTVIKPVYTAIAHDYSVPVKTEPDCTTKGQEVLKCSGCDAAQELVTSTPALGHTDVYKGADGKDVKVEHTIVEPDKNNNYSCTDTYTCTRCGEKIEKDVKTVELVIKVNDADKKPAAPGSATVTITNKATGKTYKTNNDEKGEARFIVMANQEWTVGVTGDTLPDGGYGTTIGKGQTSLELGEGTTPEEDNKDDEVESGDKCSCSCHKNSFWGILYRFFQKIIAKLFKGGKITCCDNPDPRYFK